MYRRLWTIGNREILTRRLLGFFCSTQCPGEFILRTYDVARALRDASVPVIGGFHSPMEKECLRLLLRGRQPVIVCPARSIERMRLPAEWKEPVDDGRLLILSPFDGKFRRATAELAERRNRFAAALATEVFVPFAAPDSKTQQFCSDLLSAGKAVLLLDSLHSNSLEQKGAIAVTISGLVQRLISFKTV